MTGIRHRRRASRKVDYVTSKGKDQAQETDEVQEKHDRLLSELVAHLRDNREHLREQWTGRITDARLLSAMTPDEIFSEAIGYIKMNLVHIHFARPKIFSEQ